MEQIPNKKKMHLRFRSVILLLLLLISILCYKSGEWYESVYGQTGFDSVLYTLFSGVVGVEPDLIFSYQKNVVLPAGYYFVILAVAFFTPFRNYLAVSVFGGRKIRIFPMRRWIAVTLCLCTSSFFMIEAAKSVQLGKYIDSIFNPSHFYQENYIDPDTTEITFPEQKQNLIYIFMESMETTFFSKQQGGALDQNVIPELYQLAYENINFSHNEDIGGFSSTSGSTWTIAAMVSQASGVPLKLLANMNGNEFSTKDGYLPGLTTITDILHDNGYYQGLMVGSDVAFGGREQFYSQHGVDRIYDYYTAMDDSIIPQGYYVWWGMEDKYLFEYAKQELDKIAKQKIPFAFTLLTVDTHHVGGYLCDECQSEYDEQYENVFACSSKQIDEFIGWIQQQDFYENTTIVLVGDHPSMDGAYIERQVGTYDRYMYNCFINSKAEPYKVKNRVFTTMDMFPTTLAAMGCSIEGNRLGLGTNMFSDKPTLAEEMGILTFDQESAAFSDYYMDNFARVVE